MDAAVDRAIERIREGFGERLSVSRLAETARLGRFEFARRFRETTRMSPAQFLTAVRVHEAKRLIECSGAPTAEVAAAAGFAGPRALTAAFTAATGLSPARYGLLCREQGQAPPAPDPGPGAERGAVAGTVRLPAGLGSARVYLGAFATPVVRYPALAETIVDVPADRPSCYLLSGVPAGHWHLLAVAAAAPGAGHPPRTGPVPLAGGAGASVTVTADSVTSAAVRLGPPRPADPPILLALPRLRSPADAAPPAPCAALTPPEPGGVVRAVPHGPPSGA
ncbi:helix-turn-helix domain-containing protein [Streptomyces parvulus]|uniref:helix-turn-helix domain-containing protein n=1 Tax=Streptomyces parvulus TaxID=146923 RepID=UPI0036BECB7C